jgi:hypothetical protein
LRHGQLRKAFRRFNAVRAVRAAQQRLAQRHAFLADGALELKEEVRQQRRLRLR